TKASISNKLARATGIGSSHDLDLTGGLGTGGRRPCSLSRGPAQRPPEKQNGLGVEDGDFPAKSKPPARRLSFHFDQLFRDGNHRVWRPRREAGEDRLQRHRPLRISASPVLDEKDSGAHCLRLKCCFGVGLGASLGGYVIRDRRAPEKTGEPLQVNIPM